MSAIADFDATMAGIDRSGRYFVTDLWRRTDLGRQVCARYSRGPARQTPVSRLCWPTRANPEHIIGINMPHSPLGGASFGNAVLAMFLRCGLIAAQ